MVLVRSPLKIDGAVHAMELSENYVMGMIGFVFIYDIKSLWVLQRKTIHLAYGFLNFGGKDFLDTRDFKGKTNWEFWFH